MQQNGKIEKCGAVRNPLIRGNDRKEHIEICLNFVGKWMLNMLRGKRKDNIVG